MRLIAALLLANSALPAAQPAGQPVPVFFLPNHGQAPSAVRFMAKGSGITAYFAPAEVLYRAGGHVARLRFQGASDVAPEAAGALAGRANFLIGEPSEWQLDIPLHGGVVYRGLYPGIDLSFGASGRNLKSEFLVAPGADPALIRMHYPDSEVHLAEDGDLAVVVNGQELREQAPTVYQEIAGKRSEVPGRFVLSANGVVRLKIGEYDHSLPLVIDPTISYSTLLGGSNSDAVTGLAVGTNGNAYIAGYTASYNFPTSNPEQGASGGSNDVFVAQLNGAGSGLVYCTYIGGSGDDRGYGIAVDAAGEAYVTGYTKSRNFPINKPVQSVLLGSQNAFILKLNAAGNALLLSTYLGGSAIDAGNGIGLDSAGNAYVVGDTTSINLAATGLQKSNRGGQDAFAAAIAANGSRLLYLTYLGGTGADHAAAVAVDGSGNASITGSTYSTDFPTANAFQKTLAGGQDAFVARLNSAGSALTFSTYLGGTGGSVGFPEAGQGIALDSQGNTYVAGVTASADFPLLSALQTKLSGGIDAFVAKLNGAGALVYSTLFGGSSVDFGNAVAVDSGGRAYLAGYTASTDLPMQLAGQSTIGGGYDAFVAEIGPSGNTLLWSTYLGGNGSDTATAVALDAAGNVFVAGWTLSTNFPLVNPYMSVNTDNYAAFVTKYAMATPPVNVSVTPSSGSGASQTFTFQFSNTSGASNMTSAALLISASNSATSACDIVYTPAQNTIQLLTDAGSAGSAITPGSGSLSNSQCSINGAGSTVSVSGTTLTVTVAVSFLSAFNGSKNLYLQSANSNGNTPWEAKGTWTVQVAVPSAVSVTPASGSALTQTFAFQFSDSSGATDLTTMSVLINTTASTVGACAVNFARASNAMMLLTDIGGSPGGWLTMGSGSQQNSQCALNGAGSSVQVSGNNLTLNLAFTFTSTFAGAKTVYLQAANSATSTGWQSKGSWTIPGSGNGGYTYHRAIAIDHTQVPNTDQTNFPILIAGTYSYLATASNAGKVQNPNGYDIVFSSDSAGSNLLKFERERYVAATGEVAFWVNVPVLSHTADTVIYMWYGNASVSADTAAPAAVWDSNYKGVWHLPNGTTLSALDSTSTGNNGAVTGVTATAGQIAGGANVTGAGQYIDIGNPASLGFSNAMTLEAWVNPVTVANCHACIIMAKPYAYEFGVYLDGTIKWALQNGNPGWSWQGTAPITAGVWTHVVLTYNNGVALTYINGALAHTYNGSGNLAPSTYSMRLLNRSDLDAPFNGKADEMRASSIARSADWIAAEYHNQSSPSTFYSIASEAGSNSYASHRTITIDHTKVPNTDQPGFPLLISGVYPYLASASSGGKVQNANGYDIVFTSDPAGANVLKFERERYVAATGEVAFWVNVPMVSHTADSVIYMWYGNPSVATDQAAPALVWDTNYKGVWHLPNGATLTAADSTVNANNGTVNGETAAAGEIGGGANSTGPGQYIDVGSSNSVTLTNAFTMEAWINPTTVAGCHACIIMARPNSYEFGVYLDGTVKWALNNANPGWSWQGTAPITAGAWTHVVITYNNGVALTYMNGVLSHTYNGSGSLAAPSYGLRLLNRPDMDAPFMGKADELRISSIARSADWIAAEYRNQSSPATFYTVGVEN
jgi:hypothetical protein